MAAVWHDGLVEAFPVPETASPSTSPDALSMEEATTSLATSKHPPQLSTVSPFPFFFLPAEIRNRVYGLVLFSTSDPRRPSRNYRLPTSLFLTSSRVHREASYVFYTSHAFRLFPLQEFKPLPTVSELPARYRPLVTNAELILGPSWTAPPKSWKVTPRMAKKLQQLSRLSCLRVFVEIDPSHPVFANFRVSHDFYTDFAGNLLRDVLVTLPHVEFVLLDGSPSVQVDGPLVSRLRSEAGKQGRQAYWGKERCWSPNDRSGPKGEIRSEDLIGLTGEKLPPHDVLSQAVAPLP